MSDPLGIPYTLAELRAAAPRALDEYDRALMTWAVNEIDRQDAELSQFALEIARLRRQLSEARSETDGQ